MNLYLITQEENIGYGTYDAVIVAAEFEEMARLTLPNEDDNWDGWNGWASSPDNVSVKLIGEAIQGTKYGIILASYNEG